MPCSLSPWDPEKPPGDKLFLLLCKAEPRCPSTQALAVGEVAVLQRDAGKLHSQRSCSNEKINQTSYGVGLVLKYEE